MKSRFLPTVENDTKTLGIRGGNGGKATISSPILFSFCCHFDRNVVEREIFFASFDSISCVLINPITTKWREKSILFRSIPFLVHANIRTKRSEVRNLFPFKQFLFSHFCLKIRKQNIENRKFYNLMKKHLP